MMSAGCAPTAMRMPISRVRSVTDTSMMFMTPMPPTTSETSATENSRLVTVSCVDVSMLVISAMLLVEKSSSSSGPRRCRSRSSAPISWRARGIASGDTALTKMRPGTNLPSPRCMRVWNADSGMKITSSWSEPIAF